MKLGVYREERGKVRGETAIVILSGGQDSTTCLFYALDKYKKVEAISFDDGQRHRIELECAKTICNEYGVKHQIIEIDLLNKLTDNALTRMNIEVDKEKIPDVVPNTYVEGRNMLFLMVAAIFAKTNDIHDIYIGVSESDYSGYPDCRDIFIKSLNVAVNLAMDFQFRLHAPLMWLNKAETWELADKLGVVDVIKNETVTCYNGIKGDGCGNCPACKLRNKGYEEYLVSKEK